MLKTLMRSTCPKQNIHTYKITRMSDEIKQKIRQSVVSALMCNTQTTTISNQKSTTKTERTEHKLFRKTGDASVNMDKTECKEKAKTLLQYTPIYREMDDNPTHRLATKIDATLKRLQEILQTSKDERWRMNSFMDCQKSIKK